MLVVELRRRCFFVERGIVRLAVLGLGELHRNRLLIELTQVRGHTGLRLENMIRAPRRGQIIAAFLPMPLAHHETRLILAPNFDKVLPPHISLKIIHVRRLVQLQIALLWPDQPCTLQTFFIIKVIVPRFLPFIIITSAMATPVSVIANFFYIKILAAYASTRIMITVHGNFMILGNNVTVTVIRR